MQETWVQSLSWEDPLEKGKATHSSVLAWRASWTVQSTGLQRWTQQSGFHFHYRDPITIYLVVLGLFSVGFFLLLCFLPREVPLAFSVKLVWWC